MNRDNFYFLGYITRTHGQKGELALSLDVDNPENYKKLESVFIEIDNELIPFFIEKIEIRPHNKARVLFQDTNYEKAGELIKRKIFLPLDNLPKLEGNKFYFHEVIGFEIIDTSHGSIGKISDVIEIQPQALFQVFKNKKEILIPIVDEIIKTVDKENKQITIDSPEGLIELYLGI